MFGLQMLDVLIGLITIYLTLGVACTALVEAIPSYIRSRSQNLKNALGELFSGEMGGGKKFIDELYAHPLITSLSKGPKGKPSYIPKQSISHALEDILCLKAGTESVIEAIAQLPDGKVKTLLQGLAKKAGNDTKVFLELVEQQFEHTMERASGWFKKNTQRCTLAISLTLVFAANIDTFNIVHSLSKDPAAQAQVVEIASKRLEQIETAKQDTEAKTDEQIVANAKQQYEQTLADASTTGLQFGWHTETKQIEWFSKIIGLLITAFAMSLGAPFWFNVLQKFMAVRTSLAPGDKSNAKPAG